MVHIYHNLKREPNVNQRRRNSMNYHEDDRAQRLLDVFPINGQGQVNVSYINSTEHIVAWHKHEKQTDYWICLKGSLKVGWATEEDGCEFKYLSDKNPQVLKIPPGVYHGYKALEPDTILAYYVTHKYDPKDEFRKEVGGFGEEWKTENK